MLKGCVILHYLARTWKLAKVDGKIDRADCRAILEANLSEAEKKINKNTDPQSSPSSSTNTPNMLPELQ